MTADQPQRIWMVTFEAMPGVTNPIHRLRSLLKVALRQFRLRCISVEEKTEQRDG